jgi:hypothetical protein
LHNLCKLIITNLFRIFERKINVKWQGPSFE